ncbi:GtrA family protein [Erythrobacter arachoides]|uniref:GtrA family protein n=1 Tax=Aurantiacibacter arachoides TaxID=1850444 RepID=A0A845A6J3_9SPHN|nr:GtrA family protein [Aurantiacibacter arachoides]MXO94766.1 GtrA family protein [Aurantiacibacter arachoides]GGD60860.1 hypothetical protein GCM10011411_21350 [Aurantiacibacter arachoides]
MVAAIRQVVDRRLTRYLLASVGALAVDMGTFLALLTLGPSLELAPAGASASGYALGIAAHWLMSSRAVFVGSLAERGVARHRQKVLFVASALIGLALTTGIVGAGDRAGFDPRIAKLAAIGVSFSVTWLLRSRIVFR